MELDTMQVNNLLCEPTKTGLLISDLITEDYIVIEKNEWEELKAAIERALIYYD